MSATATRAQPPGTPAASAAWRERLRWAVADTWTITHRDLLHWRYEPSRVIWTLAFPVVSILLFGYVFGSAMLVPGGGDYREFLIPGLFVMAVAFGAVGTMTAMAADTEKGVSDRFRAMPMSPVATVAGRAIADLLSSVLGLAVMVAMGLVVGWGWNDGLGNALAALGLLLWLRFATLWLGIWLGLVVPNLETAGNLAGLTFPFTMISGIFVSPSQMPGWLGTIAEWNPLSSTVLAVRDLFGNPGAVADTWVAQHATLLAVLWPLALTALFATLAVRRYHAIGR